MVKPPGTGKGTVHSAERKRCHCGPVSARDMERSRLTAAVPIKTAPQAEPGQAGRKSGDEYPNFSLLQSFSLPQYFHWLNPIRKPEGKGSWVMQSLEVSLWG